MRCLVYPDTCTLACVMSLFVSFCELLENFLLCMILKSNLLLCFLRIQFGTTFLSTSVSGRCPDHGMTLERWDSAVIQEGRTRKERRVVDSSESCGCFNYPEEEIVLIREAALFFSPRKSLLIKLMGPYKNEWPRKAVKFFLGGNIHEKIEFDALFWCIRLFLDVK